MSDLMLPEEIRAEFTVNADGSTTTSIRGAARLIGVPHNSLLYQLNGGRKQPSKLYQKLTEHGFEPGQFSQGLSEIALTLIIEHYSRPLAKVFHGMIKSYLFLELATVVKRSLSEIAVRQHSRSETASK